MVDKELMLLLLHFGPEDQLLLCLQLHTGR